MKDIARDLGVSIALVSTVLSGRMGTTGASAATRKRILKKARDVGYVPNRTAINLSSGKTGTIGVFVNPWGLKGSELAYDFLRGMSKKFNSTTYHTWLNFFEEDSDFYRQMTVQNIRQRVDGLIVGGCGHPKLLPYLRQLDKAGIPVITFFEIPPRGMINIFGDNVLQGHLPTEHLISCGCRNIAHFRVEDHRYNGYVNALRAGGLPLRSKYVVPCEDFSIEAGRAATRRLLKARIPFDGVVAQSDHHALGVVRELLARGIKVPEQVRVTGVDDGPIATASPIPLTSVTSECQNTGTLVVETMLKRIAGEPVHSIVLTPRLVRRVSS